MLLTTSAAEASAHEKWFHETENYGLRWDLLFRPLPLAFIGRFCSPRLRVGLLAQARAERICAGTGKFRRDRRAPFGFIRFDSGDSRRSRRRSAAGRRRAGTAFFAEQSIVRRLDVCVRFGANGIALAIFYGALTRLAAVALGVLWFARNFSRRA
jgi:hypothetical protein